MFKILIRSILFQPIWPIIMQDSHHTCVPQLNFGPFRMMIGHLVWEKTDLTRGPKHFAAMLSTEKSKGYESESQSIRSFSLTSLAIGFNTSETE